MIEPHELWLIEVLQQLDRLSIRDVEEEQQAAKPRLVPKKVARQKDAPALVV